MSTASDIAGLTASYFSLLLRVIRLEQRAAKDEQQIATVQQRCTRLELAVKDLNAQLARVKKG